METWTKAIPESRDRWQSAVLVWVVGTVLAVACVPMVLLCLYPSDKDRTALHAGIVSLTFALAVWVLRAATPAAAFCGGIVCWLVTFGTIDTVRWPEVHSGLMPLMTLFFLTFAATKSGKRRKRIIDAEEARRGRNAAQIVANLGAAGLAALSSFLFHGRLSQMASGAMVLGALAEATADTVSSEIGAAFGGRPFLLTTFRRVEPGTDGAVSLLGTFAGCVGAGLVVAVGVWSMGLSPREGLAAFAGGVVGLFFDSLLGATVERRGWVGNDWVNFSSTVVGGLVALGMALV